MTQLLLLVYSPVTLLQSQCSHICLQEAAATYTTYYCHQQAARQIN